MRDFYNLIIELSQKTCFKDDYESKKKVREHNRAMTKLYNLKNEMNTSECSQILLKLLEHEDDRVVLNAAMLCVELKFNLKETKRKLEWVLNESDDSILSLNAEQLLRYKF